jgi:glycosyltransferase involved in cell wall biosynthesis
MPSNSPLTICALVNIWPRLATTFIAQEFIGLEALGLNLWLAALEDGGSVRHGLHDQVRAPVHHVPENPFRNPAKLLRAWRKVSRSRSPDRALSMLRDDLRTLKRPRRKLVAFARAVLLAAEIPAQARMIYFHFLYPPGAIARYTAALTGLPLAASAHARDIFTRPDAELRQVLAETEWVTTCNIPGADRLRQLAPRPESIHLIYHGLSLTRFPEDPPERGARDGTDPNAPVRLLSVGRAVEKKGFDVLLEALASLPPELNWHWQHIGAGKRFEALQDHAERLGLNDRITWCGAQDQTFVIDAYRNSDLFVLPSRQAADGDQDGLPNVLMEAQTQALACLSTNFTAIPELIDDGRTGLLVPPGDVEALAEALADLIRSPERRNAIGMAGYERVRRDFRAEDGIAEIARLIRETARLGRK